MKIWGIHENTMRKPSPKCLKISKKMFPEKALFSAWKCIAQMREGRSGLLQIHNGMSLEIVLLIALVHGVNVSNVGDFILEY